MTKQEAVDLVNSARWSHQTMLRLGRLRFLTAVPKENGTYEMTVDVDKVTTIQDLHGV